MAKDDGGLFETLFHQRVLQRWAQAARRARGANLSVLRRQYTRALRLKSHLDQVLRVADDRLALPMHGGGALRNAFDADWIWRPDIWRYPMAQRGLAVAPTGTTLDDQISLFHDCPHGDLTLRQMRNTDPEALAPYALRLEVFGFKGSFLSVAINLPDTAIAGLSKTHVVHLDTQIELERAVYCVARLNVRNGPNTEQLTETISTEKERSVVAFDLAYSGLKNKPVDHAWIDVIFESPGMNQVILRDLTVARSARAEL